MSMSVDEIAEVTAELLRASSCLRALSLLVHEREVWVKVDRNLPGQFWRSLYPTVLVDGLTCQW